jgi:hypothetical protein
MQSFIPEGHRLVKVNHKTWIQLEHGQEAKEIKTDKDYVPENNNKRGAGKIVMYKGRIYQSISILAEHLGVKRWNLSKQIKAGKIVVKILK